MAMKRSTPSPTPPPPTPLALYMDRVQQSHEPPWNDTYVARRAVDRGFKISKQWVSGMKKVPPRTIVPATVRTLAAGLGVNERDVVEVLLLTVGLPVPTIQEDWTIETAIRRDTEISPDAKRMLLQQVAAARAQDAPKPRRKRKIDAPLTRDPIEPAPSLRPRNPRAGNA